MNDTTIRRGALLFFFTQIVWFNNSLAQDVNDRPDIEALRTESPPVVDGLLDDAVWQQATRQSNFRQTQPVLNADPSENSYFQIAYDSDNLYVAFRAFDSDPARVVATELRRDADMESQDHVVFMFDTFSDRRNAFGFAMNPAGALHDARIENNENWVSQWNGIWDGKARMDDEG
ncbi:MAG: hypothetical protein RLZZ227_1202, partial [Pseudomonadota bacterium]